MTTNPTVDLSGDAFQWQTFLDTPPEEHFYESARFVVIPVPYDGTTSFRAGARYGPASIIDSSRHLEDYDVETEADPSSEGIFTYPEITPDLSSPTHVVDQVQSLVEGVITHAKVPVVLGGEHTIAVGAVRACSRAFEDLTVLYLDAHGDLRNSFMRAHVGHATTARRVHEICPLVEVGVRSISKEEVEFAQDEGIPIHYWPPGCELDRLVDRVCSELTENIYVSIDLDVLDPSIMPAVGTPDPGGMTWWEVTRLLRRVAEESNVVGFDVVELSPEEGPMSCSSTAARLVYKMMGYIVAGGK